MSLKKKLTVTIVLVALTVALAPMPAAAEPARGVPSRLGALWAPLGQVWSFLGTLWNKAGVEIDPAGIFGGGNPTQTGAWSDPSDNSTPSQPVPDVAYGKTPSVRGNQAFTQPKSH